ncbi:MFS transporter [Lentzea chajnantorensis]
MIPRMRLPKAFHPLRHRRFRRLWTGQVFSALGNGLTPVALTLLVLSGDRPASALGWVLGAQSAGLILFVVVGGMLGDRGDRVLLMTLADVVRLVAVLVLATVGSGAAVPTLMVITFVLGVGGAMFEPAARALLPSLVPDDDLQAANGLNGVTNRVALIIGPPVGAALFTALGPSVVFAVDAATFLISVVALIGLRTTGSAPRRAESGRSPVSEALEGVRAVGRQPWVGAVILQGAVQVLLVHAPLAVLAPIVLRSRGELGSYGWLLSLQAAGAVGGALMAGRWKPKEPGTVALMAMLGAGPVLVGLAAGFPVPVLALLMAVYGAGGSLFAVLWVSALQRRVPDTVLARVVSLDYLGQLGLEPVGLALTAPFAAVAGIAAAIWVSISALVVTTALPFAVRGVRTFGADRDEKELSR